MELCPADRRELTACWALAPNMKAALALEFVPRMFMTDASPTGGDLVAAPASHAELRLESRYGERSGWVVITETDRILSAHRSDAAQGDEVDIETLPSPDLIFNILVAGGGERREGDLPDWINQVCENINVHCHIEHADPLGYPREDFTTDGFINKRTEQIEQGFFDAVVFLSPFVVGDCNRAQKFPLPASILAAKMMVLKRSFWVTHRVPDQKQLSPGWKDPTVQNLLEPAHELRAHICCTGEAPMMELRILEGPNPGDNSLAERCPLAEKYVLSGDPTAPGEYELKLPELLAKTLAVRIMKVMLSSEGVGRRSEAQVEQLDEHQFTRRLLSGTPGERVRAPPISEEWNDVSRWHEIFRLLWGRPEPSNILETTMACTAVRHVARSQEHWGKKMLLVTDNLCCLAVLSKGRSSNKRLGMIAKMVAAVPIATGIRLILRWCRSRFNHADGPSRQRPIGYAG